MLGAAPLAPVAPELTALATAFALLLLGVVIWGMRSLYMQTFGALLQELAKLLRRIPFGVGGSIAKGVDAINDRVQAAMATAQSWANKGAALAWHQFTLIVAYTAETISDLAHATESALGGLITAVIPNAVGAGTKPLRGQLAVIRAQLKALGRDLEHRLTRRAQAIEAELDQRFGLAREGIDAVRGSLSARIAHAVRVLQGDIAALRGYAHRTLNRRLTRVEKALGATVLGGIAIAAMTRVFPYWQCTNVRRFNRLLCRSPFGALDDLLGLALLAFGPLSLHQFASELQGIMGEVSDGIDYFVNE